MRSITWRAAVSGAFCSAIVSALVFGAQTSSATEVVVVPPPDKGTLFLKPGPYPGKLQFKWIQAEQPDVVQLIIDKSWITKKWSDVCLALLRPATVPPVGETAGVGLVTLSAAAGFLGDHVGVKGTGYCSEISGSESLTITLGGALTGYQVYKTELNLEMRKKTAVQIETSFNGQTQTFVIKTADSTYAGGTVCAFETGIAEKDICKWKSDAFWNSIKIKALAGTVMVEAGSGGGGTYSKFSLTQLDEILPCAPTTPGVPPVGITAEGQAGAIAVGTRLKNVDPLQTCQPIPASLAWSEDSEGPVLEFFKADLGQSVATTFTINWPDAPAPAGGFAAIPLSQQQFGTEAPIDLDLCVGTPIYEDFPDPDHPGEFLRLLIALEGIPPGSDQSIPLPGFQYGCVYDRHITFPNPGDGPSIIGLEELIYLEGDWKASRN